ncbi:hypothetical protein [Streptomyces sp. NPDC048603]|uniref:hypothetical protein n=1 Tax=Streptomyces sp. NPDC048603 TaxID=3365577 RepID=UPI00371A380E
MVIFVALEAGPVMIRTEQGALTNGTRRAILRPVASRSPDRSGSEAWIDYEEGSIDTRSVFGAREGCGAFNNTGKVFCRASETWSGHQ